MTKLMLTLTSLAFAAHASVTNASAPSTLTVIELHPPLDRNAISELIRTHVPRADRKLDAREGTELIRGDIELRIGDMSPRDEVRFAIELESALRGQVNVKPKLDVSEANISMRNAAGDGAWPSDPRGDIAANSITIYQEVPPELAWAVELMAEARAAGGRQSACDGLLQKH